MSLLLPLSFLQQSGLHSLYHCFHGMRVGLVLYACCSICIRTHRGTKYFSPIVVLLSVLCFRAFVAMGCFRESLKLQQQEREKQRDQSQEDTRSSSTNSSSFVSTQSSNPPFYPATGVGVGVSATDTIPYTPKFQIPFSIVLIQIFWLGCGME